MSEIDYETLNISQREARHFYPPDVITGEMARKAWVAARLFDAWWDMMNDGPDDSDKMMAQRWFEAGLALARELRPA